MKKWLTVGVLGILVFGALSAVMIGTAFAQDTTTPETETETETVTPKFFFGRGLGFGADRDVALAAAAEALGMTTDELTTQLWGGKTLADLAEETGVELADVQAAVAAAQEQAVRESIEQAVTDGTLTREHADWLLEGLDNGYWQAGGHAVFGGHGGRGGHGMFPDLDDGTTTITPSGDA